MNNPSAFVLVNAAGLYGAAAIAAGTPGYFNDSNANQIVNAGNGIRLDKVNVNFAAAATGFAKQALAYLNLTGTTAITIDLTNLGATVTGVQNIGDTSLSFMNQLVFTNTGTQDLAIAPGGSNGYNGPSVTVKAGSQVSWQAIAGVAVTGSAKTITVTPTAGGSLGISVGGS